MFWVCGGRLDGCVTIPTVTSCAALLSFIKVCLVFFFSFPCRDWHGHVPASFVLCCSASCRSLPRSPRPISGWVWQRSLSRLHNTPHRGLCQRNLNANVMVLVFLLRRISSEYWLRQTEVRTPDTRPTSENGVWHSSTNQDQVVSIFVWSFLFHHRVQTKEKWNVVFEYFLARCSSHRSFEYKLHHRTKGFNS